MGYRILYDNEKMRIEKENRKTFHVKVTSVLLVCLLVIGSLKLIGWDKLKHYLLPGDPEVTESAFICMVENIRSGESVKDAITTFCVEIIEHAK